MGYWSETILGGDVPMDILGDIEDTLKKYAEGTIDRIDGLYPLERLVSDEDACNDLRAVFEKHIEEVLGAINFWGESGRDEGLLVVGSVAMAIGAHVYETLRSGVATK